MRADHCQPERKPLALEYNSMSHPAAIVINNSSQVLSSLRQAVQASVAAAAAAANAVNAGASSGTSSGGSSGNGSGGGGSGANNSATGANTSSASSSSHLISGTHHRPIFPKLSTSQPELASLLKALER